MAYECEFETYLLHYLESYCADRHISLIYVRHTQGEHGPHIHALLRPSVEVDEKKFKDAVRRNLVNKSKRDKLKPVSASVFRIRISKKSLLEWMEYVKWEQDENPLMELEGSITDVEKEIWDGIKEDEYRAAKTDQMRTKVEYAREVKQTNKLLDIKEVSRIINTYNIEGITELTKIPKHEYLNLMTIYSFEHISQRLIDLRQRERYQFETQCRDKDNVWSWWQVGLSSLIRHGLTLNDNTNLAALNVNYLVAGMELIDCIFKRNHINKDEFNDVVHKIFTCAEDKKNTLYLVGASDAGKTTLSKLLGTPYLRATIGQAGNASQFIFQDIIDKTLIMMEEACFIPGTVDDFKNVMGGEQNFSVNIKNKGNRRMNVRTPVITTSNDRPWAQWCPQHEETFMNRGYVFNLITPILKSQIAEICTAYSDICMAGKIPLNLMHYICYMACNEDYTFKDMAKQYIAGFNALRTHKWNQSQYYIDISHDKFVSLLNTPYPDEIVLEDNVNYSLFPDDEEDNDLDIDALINEFFGK